MEPTDRLHHLRLAIGYLTNYIFIETYHSLRDLEQMWQRMSYDLGEVLEVTLAGSAKVNLDRIRDLNLAQLTKWEKEIESFLQTVRSYPLYQELMQAYQQEDQCKIAKLVPSVFGLKEKLDQKMVYHGVRLRSVNGELDRQESCREISDCVSPKEYVSWILRIQSEGVRASFQGLHYGADEVIAPIFGVDNPAITHGLICMKLEAGPRPVFGGLPRKGGREYLVYTSILNPFTPLFLKSEELTVSDNGGAVLGIQNRELMEELRKYRREVETELHRREVPFELVNT